MPMIEVSEEEFEERQQLEVLGRISAARRRGDRAEMRRLHREFAPSPEILLAVKKVLGAEWIRERGYDTRRADEAYGPGWLDDPG